VAIKLINDWNYLCYMFNYLYSYFRWIISLMFMDENLLLFHWLNFTKA